MKIFDYNPGFGTFSAGFETFPKNEVVETLKIAKDGEYGYNQTHKQWFKPSFDRISEYKLENPIDLAILQPDFGGKIAKGGRGTFSNYDFINCLRFLNREKPEFAIFITDSHAVECLNTSKNYVRDGFGQVSRDIIIENLLKMGYDAYLVPIDEANFGIPIHRGFAFYVATPKDYGFQPIPPRYTQDGFGPYKKFRTIADAISDLGRLGEWVEYKSAPANIFQHQMRQHARKVTWHHTQNLKKPSLEKIASVKQGHFAGTTDAFKTKSGYKRPFWDETPTLDDKFYSVSSSGACLHPIENRPFTIREGCRLHGLPDSLSFDLRSSRKSLAQIIHKSVSPVLGEIMAVMLREF